MSLDLAELDHNCNVVRRQIEEEFKNFTPLFIVHRSGEREKTLLSKKNHILSKPFGRKVFDTLSMTKNISRDRSEFTGLIVNQSRTIGLFKKKHFTAIFFINADDFVVDQNAKHQLYHLIWHAMNTYKKAIIELEQDKKFQKIKMFKSEEQDFKQITHNLMADVFGAIMMETQGHEGYIQNLAVKRNKEALKAIKNIETEKYPYPVAYDACQFVYDDLKGSIDPKSKLINQVLDIASEVASTYGDSAVKEWLSFSRPSQTMAWMGYSARQILGTAIYTSEDTHIRALAYMIAENINSETETNIESVEYNPFVDDSLNERNHNRIAEEQFQDLFEKFSETENADILLLEAKRQTAKLLEGIPTGWVAPALVQAVKAYENNMPRNPQVVRNNYYQTLQALPWNTIKKLSNFIIKIKKADKNITEEALIKLLEDKQGLENIVETFRVVKDIELPSDKAQSQQTGQIKKFLYSSHKVEKGKAE